MKRLITLGAAALAVLSVATPSTARQTGEDLVSRLLVAAEEAFRANDRNVEPKAEFRFTLQQEGIEAETVRLESGQRYVAVGVCDEDCTDLDLAVGAPDGSVAGRDVLDDDAPLVDFRATASGDYQIVASMAGCARAPCLAGVRVYRVR